MEKLTSWMEEHFVPIAIKIGSQKHLVAIRDAFISIMPITMAGSVAVLLNALVRVSPLNLVQMALPMHLVGLLVSMETFGLEHWQF